MHYPERCKQEILEELCLEAISQATVRAKGWPGAGELMNAASMNGVL
jgi:hypothetical protein